MLTLRRIYNALCANLSYALSHLGIVRIFHYPTFVSVEPANYCQLHCPECPVGAGSSLQLPPKGEGLTGVASNTSKTSLSLDSFRRILAEVGPWVHTMQFYWQGEPLLNKQLPEMIRLAHEAGLYTIVSTNAQALTEDMARQLYEAGLSRIIVSIDGFTQESYEAYRQGGKLDKALAGLRHRSAKLVELQVLRLRTNEHEWAWIEQHHRQLGADRLVFKTAQLYDYEHGHPLMPSDERYSRYTQGPDGVYRVKKRKRGNGAMLLRKWGNGCHRLWTGCVITVTGEVLPCCYDKGHEYPLGNLLQQDLRSIWYGEKANAFRKYYLQNAFDIAICRNCDQ